MGVAAALVVVACIIAVIMITSSLVGASSAVRAIGGDVWRAVARIEGATPTAQKENKQARAAQGKAERRMKQTEERMLGRRDLCKRVRRGR